MTPKEKFNRDTWYVLNKIKERSLYAKAESPIEYWVYFSVIAAGYPLAKDEAAILEKLEEWGAIRILNRVGNKVDN